MDNYILNGKEPVIEPDLIKWSSWFETAERHVKLTEPEQGVKVSTVFLGLDHGFDGEVFLFETMVFGGEYDGYCERYSTWDEAEKGHKKAINMINKLKLPFSKTKLK